MHLDVRAINTFTLENLITNFAELTFESEIGTHLVVLMPV